MSSTPTLRIFSFEELKASTRNFRRDLVIGEGGFGRVYKGWIHEKSSAREGSGSIVAVKMLNREGFQGFQEWQVITNHSVQVVSKINGSLLLCINIKDLNNYQFVMLMTQISLSLLSYCLRSN